MPVFKNKECGCRSVEEATDCKFVLTNINEEPSESNKLRIGSESFEDVDSDMIFFA